MVGRNHQHKYVDPHPNIQQRPKKKKLRAIRLTKISLIKFVYFFRDAGPADGEEEAVSRQGSGSPADERWDANKKKLGDDGEG